MVPSPSRARWTIPEPRGPIQLFSQWAHSPYVGVRVLCCAIAGLAIWLACAGWAPSFPYRARLAPLHNLQTRVAFDVVDRTATREARTAARRTALCYYRHAPALLENLRLALRDRVFEVRQAEFNDYQRQLWTEFFPAVAASDAADRPTADSYARFQRALARDEKLEGIARGIERGLREVERHGLLEVLGHEFGEGDMQRIVVVRGSLADTSEIDVADVRISLVADKLRRRMLDSLAAESTLIDEAPFVADRLVDWLLPKLPTTLSWDRALTKRQADQAIAQLPPVFHHYEAGDPLEVVDDDDAESPAVAIGRQPLSAEELELLRAEHDAYVAKLPLSAKLTHALAFLGMLAAALSLLVAYLHYRDRELLDQLRRFATILGLFVATFISAWLLAANPESRAELIPVVMLATLVAIAFDVELAIFLSGLVALVFSIAHGYGLGAFVLLSGTSCTASLMCRSIRSRTRLIYVGAAAAAVAGLTALGVHYMLGQPLGAGILVDALWYAGGAMLAALLMTAALPFLERWFEIHTDISLLELGDANHPLLRELVQRAPGTYNHSISVASIAEAAAETVGANGLLCRVGAYFHDIGKMRKPEYFVENQIGDDNKHADLVPTMSTLVIIAHVKEGAEMARQHRLPRRVIDIIEQHHGTTLVEYFYNQASQRAAEDEEPSEASFRYPGPKPQSREAAIVMLADAAESASRALRDPGPARLESLVDSLVLKRMTAGQLDDCSLTMSELREVQTSLIKSLNAMYHARIKYPDSTQGA